MCIFQLPLQITRCFIENADGTYNSYDPRPLHLDQLVDSKNKELPIRPFELKTYLKVGKFCLI